ncbi:MAG: hypothetical protein MJ094_05250 [Saccharofermentans sp.]|nr:hypothetical protein [Saccharofermentans sp.]
MNITFNKSFLIARSNWARNRLLQIPIIKLGRLNGEDVIREYHFSESGKKSYNKHFPSSPSYLSMFSLAKEREQLLAEVKNLPNHSIRLKPIGMIRMTDDKWAKLPDCANPEPINSEYYYNNIHLRSRFEMIVATELGSLNLQFKYEAALNLCGEIIYPDFIVYLPELGMCFIIECLGMTDKANYSLKNGIRISNYITSGYEFCKDLILLNGTKDYLPDVATIRNLIVMTINNIADMSVIDSSTCSRIDI